MNRAVKSDDLIRDLKQLSINDTGPKVPKGKRSAYVFFYQEQHSLLKDKGQTMALPLLSKHCSLKWKETSDKEKQKYKRKAKEDSDRYEAEMAEYEKQKKAFDQKVEELVDSNQLKLHDRKRTGKSGQTSGKVSAGTENKKNGQNKEEESESEVEEEEESEESEEGSGEEEEEEGSDAEGDSEEEVGTDRTVSTEDEDKEVSDSVSTDEKEDSDDSNRKKKRLPVPKTRLFK